MNPPYIVLITGPIASGKTSTARALAQRRRDTGQTAAALDLDDFVEMVAGSDWTMVRRERWQLASGAAAASIGELFENGVNWVFLAGPFFSARMRALVINAVRFAADVRLVVLDVDIEETIRRAALDGDRVLTKDPAFIRKIYATIVWDELPADAIRIAAADLDETAVTIAIERALSL